MGTVLPAPPVPGMAPAAPPPPAPTFPGGQNTPVQSCPFPPPLPGPPAGPAGEVADSNCVGGAAARRRRQRRSPAPSSSRQPARTTRPPPPQSSKPCHRPAIAAAREPPAQTYRRSPGSAHDHSERAICVVVVLAGISADRTAVSSTATPPDTESPPRCADRGHVERCHPVGNDEYAGLGVGAGDRRRRDRHRRVIITKVNVAECVTDAGTADCRRERRRCRQPRSPPPSSRPLPPPRRPLPRHGELHCA